MQVFEWEKPLVELEQRIAELRQFVGAQDIDCSTKIGILERKAEQLRKNIYEKLTPYQRVMMWLSLVFLMVNPLR